MPEPLPSQLSRALVAFTIEADDELEHRIPHRTTEHGTRAGGADAGTAPWLVSLLMWSMCVRFVPPEGTTVRELARSAWWLTPKGISTTLRRVGGWWRYLTVGEPAGAAAPAARGDRVVCLTAGGMRARDAWEPLVRDVEERWEDRFGEAQVSALRSVLGELLAGHDAPLPDCLRCYDVDIGRRPPDGRRRPPAVGGGCARRRHRAPLGPAARQAAPGCCAQRPRTGHRRPRGRGRPTLGRLLPVTRTAGGPPCPAPTPSPTTPTSPIGAATSTAPDTSSPRPPPRPGHSPHRRGPPGCRAQTAGPPP